MAPLRTVLSTAKVLPGLTLVIGVIAVGASAFGGLPTTHGVVRFSVSTESGMAPDRVTITCDNGFSSTVASAGAGHFEVPGVPASDCTASFQGGSPARFRPALAGEDYQCIHRDARVYCAGSLRGAPAPPPVVTVPAVVAPEPVPTPSYTQSAALTGTESAGGTVAVRLAAPNMATWALLVCPGGQRLRAEVVGTSATFSGVPDEGCLMTLKGGLQGRHAGVRPGMSLSCDRNGSMIFCTESTLSSGRSQADAAAPPASAAPVVPPTPPTAPTTTGDGSLRIRLSNPRDSAWVLLTCPGGHTARAMFEDSIAVFSELPDEGCTVTFKGSSPARYAGMRGGERYVCGIKGARADCTRE